MTSYSITKNYNREGNDCFLWDKIEILREDGDIVLRHTHKEKGSWFEPVLWTKNTILYSFGAVSICEKVNDYLSKNLLDDNISFTSSEISENLRI